jgi:transcription initiation factor TFIID TATA-box-binding protein
MLSSAAKTATSYSMPASASTSASNASALYNGHASNGSNAYSSSSNSTAESLPPAGHTNGDLSSSVAETETDASDSPEIDIVINNVVGSFSVRCHLNLRDIALRGINVEYRKENGVRKIVLVEWKYYFGLFSSAE